ncbi:FKBP-type peptidyl-prolyl cis-trans isomerase [Mucilaginibacter aquatilis]|uniref:FKBP-type peptidyl-prolyl cis-trans isomerase n=1 Tax=Mucilaginibacter aquatilis TaxID=1517760 RepID=UPI001E4A0C50|nr:FKBP-type peptidyl-prolyl cis-trans isomerase [Mucilaginibacter aquatilis]
MKKALLLTVFVAAYIGQAAAQANYTKTPKGALYTILKAGGGAKIKQGEVITFQFTQKNDRDSLLGSSYQMGKPAMVQVQPSRSVSDLMEVFTVLSVNDSARVRIPTDSIFAGREDGRPPFLPKGSYLNFTIKVEKTQSLDEAMAERNAAMEKEKTERAAMAEKLRGEEKATLARYIADNQLTPQTTTSGLKYIITTPSAGRKPVNGDTLLVNYAGRTMDGKLFDSSIEEVAKAGGLQQPGRNYEPIKVVVGDGQVIRGWDEGLLLVNEGAKAKFIIPSALAYGERGAGADIKPYSPLVFDVEVVKVIPGVRKKAVAKTGVKRAPAKKATGKRAATKRKVTKK